MKIPVEWLKQYIKTEKETKELAQSFTFLGLMLDKPLADYMDGSYTTPILDLEHRMDRSDWLSITGCARDLAAFERVDFISPELYTQEGKKPNSDQIVDVKVECPDMVNRFNTRVFRNIRVGESPAWLKNRLQSYGIPSINNIVDITNYVMVETGQPLHAQDLAKLEKPEIIIRKARKGEKMVTLLGDTVELDESNFVLTQNDKPTVIGGIVGGQTTGISNTTTDFVLDAGNYNQTAIRKASRRIKIQNETVLRCDKFLHPDLTEYAIHRATKLILELAGGIYYSNIDWYPNQQKHKKFILRMERLEKLSGMTFLKAGVKEILVRLGYVILNEDRTLYGSKNSLL
jgi:phenylalanyl-tRNA synthetase beta chain